MVSNALVLGLAARSGPCSTSFPLREDLKLYGEGSADLILFWLLTWGFVLSNGIALCKL